MNPCLKDISILLKYVSFLNLVSKSESILLQLYQWKVYDWKYSFHWKGICIPEIRAESSSLLQKEYQYNIFEVTTNLFLKSLVTERNIILGSFSNEISYIFKKYSLKVFENIKRPQLIHWVFYVVAKIDQQH